MFPGQVELLLFVLPASRTQMGFSFTVGPFLAHFFCLALCAIDEEPLFYESFEETWVGRWTPASKGEYQGVWKQAKSDGHENYGLLVSEKARKYGIAISLKKPIEFKEKPIVLQYDLRLQNGIECGGAYLKFLQLQEEEWTPSLLDNESPYSIMFGPDRCGSTNKIHFIFRHRHPRTGKYLQHHLKFPPSPVNDKLSHVYTAVIYPNNSLSILVDGVVKKWADLLSLDFHPAVLPPKSIPDPEDKKPDDWDERPKIPDPGAMKPEVWDEDAPYEVEDTEAVKPKGWLDDQPVEVDDEEAVKPEDWDDDEDGEWEAPKVPNPKCVAAPGCGEWKRPMKKNPAYKGKWHASLIENPNYKGNWKAREIPNPSYFHLDKPNLEPITAIAVEIWTMQDGMLFDNILVTNDEGLAKEYRDKEWKVKYDAEKEQQKKEETEKDAKTGALVSLHNIIFKLLYKIAELPFLASRKEKVMELIEKVEEKASPLSIVVCVVGLILSRVMYGALFTGKKQQKVTVEKAKKRDITQVDDPSNLQKSKGKGKEKVEYEVNGIIEGGPRPRRSHRDA